MTKMLIAAAGGLASALVATASRAGDFYVSGALDGVWRDAATTQIAVPPALYGGDVLNRRTNFETGGEADTAAGYAFGLGGYGQLRTEAEFGFRHFEISDITTKTPRGQGDGVAYTATVTPVNGLDQERYSETVNVFYDFTRFRSFTPYVGAGAGYQEGVQISGTVVRTYSLTTSGFQLGGTSAPQQVVGSHSDEGTWLLEAGVGLPIASHLTLTPAYRYTQGFDCHSAANVMRVGLRYSF